MESNSSYRLVRLPNGAHSLHSLAYGETMHPVVGPVVEAEALYVRQLRLADRLRRHPGEFVIWDVGLGGAANALTVLRAAQTAPRTRIRLLSFDHTPEPLLFALEHARELPYLEGFEPYLRQLLEEKRTVLKSESCEVDWTLQLADFSDNLQQPEAGQWPKPHVILFDPFSPAKNPAMWTQPLFTRLFSLLDPAQPCVMPTYSRSTMLRVTLLLAGFFVGVGQAVGSKEETTVAANCQEWIETPLDRRWLAKVRLSTSAEPLQDAVYRREALSSANWERLLGHAQWRG